jgi:hypothetical protein
LNKIKTFFKAVIQILKYGHTDGKEDLCILAQYKLDFKNNRKVPKQTILATHKYFDDTDTTENK